MNEPNQGTSVLRQRMIEDMRTRKLSPKTQAAYIRAVRRLAAYLGRSPDTATVEELRAYQLHLVDQGTSALAQTGLQKVNHIIIVMQENHSFDNYFGALAYAPGTPITRRTAIADVDQTTMRAWMDCLALRTHRAGSIASIRI